MLTIDFESFSQEDLTLASSYKYMIHPEADIVCLAYKFDNEDTKLWTPATKSINIGRVFDYVSGGGKVHAHNALFEYLAWNELGHGLYGWPEITLEQLVDTQALAMRYGLPGSLEKAGAVLELEVQKQQGGLALIKKICCPTAAGNRPVMGPDYTHNDYVQLLDYCKQDVNSTALLASTLPAPELSEQEQHYWVMTQKMNLMGLPMDVKLAERILAYASTYVEEMTNRVPELCDSAFQKVTQVAKMRTWMELQGCKVANLQASTVEILLREPDVPPLVREMLELRQAIGGSATAKYKKIEEMQVNGRVYNNLCYYGAGTGRLAGRGFQMHNMPRASVPDPDALADDIYNFRTVDDPVYAAKALVRYTITAPKGRALIVSDYSAIENILIMWLAGEEEVLESIRSGRDQYVEMASYMYNTPYDKLKAGHLASDKVSCHQRRIGKIIVLGCGFQMGGKRFQASAEEQGVKLELHESYAAVEAFRRKHPRVKEMWKRFSTCVIGAIRNPGDTYEFRGCKFHVVKDRSGNNWLVFVLPSGRNIFYMDPHLSSDQYGVVPGHMGTHPKTKQWARRKLIPGRITENIIQALARDIMMHGLERVEKRMPYVDLLGSVHDEAIGEMDDSEFNGERLKIFDDCLCTLPSWAEGLPLKSEGYVAKHYKKG